MRIAFVYGNLYLWGGIQTWLIRMSRVLSEAGHEVAILTRPRSAPWDLTDEVVDELSRHATIHLAGRHWFRAAADANPPLERPDVLFGCNVDGLLQAAQVQSRLTPAPRLVAGVFHPREFSAP